MKVTSQIRPTVLHMTALESLRAVAGDAVQRHNAIIIHVATIMALAMCDKPPKGVGTPADHTRIHGVLESAGLKRYAEHSIAIKVALKPLMRSVAEWDDACAQAMAIAAQAFAGCAPKVLSKAQQKEREDKKAAAKAERERIAAEEKAKANDLRAQELQQAQAAGAAGVTITAQMVADLIRTGSLSLDAILDALGMEVVPVSSGTVVDAVVPALVQ